MDVNKVLQHLDELFLKKKISEVESYLEEQISIAVREKDDNSLITLLNEMIGYQRDTSQYEKALAYCKRVLSLMDSLGLSQTTYYGTTLINVANVYRAAHMPEKSMECYNQVFALYKDKVEETDFNYASLYNNMSLLYQEINDYEKAVECLLKALEIVKLYPQKEIQLAVTYGNLGESYLKLDQIDKATECLKKAYEIYSKDEKKDFHYGATVSALGEVAFRKGQYKRAEELYKEALYEININVGKTEAYRITEENLKIIREIMKDGSNITESTKEPTKGMEIKEHFFNQYGKSLMDKFPEYKDKMAVGYVGHGSECFGFDDELSKDHDFNCGFILWLPEEIYLQIGTAMQLEYDKLYEEHAKSTSYMSNVGKTRDGIKSIEGFYGEILGKEKFQRILNGDIKAWLEIDEWSLAAATNGKVFVDNYKEFTKVRELILGYYPELVWRRRLANEMYNFSQKGQYNYGRMVKRGDLVTAQIVLGDFMQHTMAIVYILNRKYAPFYKWIHRGMDKLEKLAGVMDILNAIVDMPKGDERIEMTIEIIAGIILEEMKQQGLVTGMDTYIESHINEVLKMEGKQKDKLEKEIVALEWEAFDKVQNLGGRANCQDDWNTFSIMRNSQYMTWPEPLISSYISDFRRANESGWNLITEKYGRMMESTDPDEYNKMKSIFPYISPEEKNIIEEIVKIQVEWMEEFARLYPKSAYNARSIHTWEDSPNNASYETYLRGEISTYSQATLKLYGDFVVGIFKDGNNLAKMTMNNTAILYGYSGVDELEERL